VARARAEGARCPHCGAPSDPEPARGRESLSGGIGGLPRSLSVDFRELAGTARIRLQCRGCARSCDASELRFDPPSA
jgi:hypothetical protein